jgi:hypothetical protein
MLKLQPLRNYIVIKTKINLTNLNNMRNPIIIFFILLPVLFFHLGLIGQENYHKKNWFSKHPVDFAFGSASVDVPFTNFFKSPFYPMVSLGTEFYYKQKDNFDFYQSARMSYYFAKYSTSAIVLNSEVGFRYIFNFGLFADVGLGVGYAHLFRPGAIYEQNTNGEYHSKYYTSNIFVPTPPGLVQCYFDRLGDGKIENVSATNNYLTKIFTGSDGIMASVYDYYLFIDALVNGNLVSDESFEAMTTSYIK